MKQQTAKKLAGNDVASVVMEEKLIKKLKEQQEAEENRKTFRKCMNKMLGSNHDTHQLLREVHDEVCYLNAISTRRSLS